jgi:glycosyltransferase involved in cell wall biosynthesis
VPSVVSKIYGLRDSIIDRETGFFFDPGNVEDLYNKIEYLYSNQDILEKMKNDCKFFVKENFDSKIVSKSLVDFYLSIIKNG